MKKTLIITTVIVLALLLMAGIFIPIDSYMSKKVCKMALHTREIRHDLIFGGSLESIRQSDDHWSAEEIAITRMPCPAENSINKLYLL